ncbi:MAG: hypothetical protein WC314_26790 [Vulcanimicrobiota bacterium]
MFSKSHYLLLIVLASALLLFGCENAGVDRRSESSFASGGGQPSLPVHQFSSIVHLSFVEGLEEEGVSEQVRAQGDLPTSLRQMANIIDQSHRPLAYRLLEGGPDPVCYTPNSHTAIGGIWDNFGYVTFHGGGQQQIQYTWTLPHLDSGLPTLLLFNNFANSFADRAIPNSDEYVVVEGDTVVLTLDFVGDKWVASVNGQQLSEDAASKIPTGRVPSPLFRSQRNGLHTVETNVSSSNQSLVTIGAYDTTSKSYSYYQRGLVFLDEFPKFEPGYRPESEPPEPIPIENRIAWSDAAELNDGDVTWSVAGSGSSKSGTGKAISALWNPVDRVLTRAAEGEEKKGVENFEEVSLRVIARTDIYDGPDWFFPITYRIEHRFGVPGAAELRVVKAEVAPDAFSDDNPYAELTAEVVLIGLQPMDYDISWTVHLKDPAGDIVVPDLADGQGWEINALWDGTIDGQQVEEPGSYSFEIEARACPPDDGGGAAERSIRTQETPGGSGCLEAEAEVPISNENGTLEIYDGDTDELLATSEPQPYVGVSDPLLASLELVALGPTFHLSSSNDQILQKRRGQSNTIKIRYLVDKSKAEGKETIEVSIRSTFSNQNPFTTTLSRGTDGIIRAEFSDVFTLTDSGNSGGKSILIRTPSGSSFTTVDVTSGKVRPGDHPEHDYWNGDAQDADEWQKGESGTKLGFASALTPSEEQSKAYRAQKIPPVQEAVVASGFEDLVVERPGTGIRAWTRVKNQAKRLYISSHGYPDGGFLVEGGYVEPGDIGEHWKDDVELVIMALCSVLNIGNFNDWTGYQGQPGAEWQARMKPGGVVLGYNAIAPAADLRLGGVYADTRILMRYRENLAQSSYSDPAEAQAMAWLLANASMEVRLGDDACAVTPEYYYFIHTEPFLGEDRVTTPAYQNDAGVRSKNRGIWRLHRSKWGLRGRAAFNALPRRPDSRTLMRKLPDAGPGEADKI